MKKNNTRKEDINLVAQDQARVARAFHELYHNPQTPTQLWHALGSSFAKL